VLAHHHFHHLIIIIQEYKEEEAKTPSALLNTCAYYSNTLSVFSNVRKWWNYYY